MRQWWRRASQAPTAARARSGEKALDWHQCAACAYDISSGEGDCRWGACSTQPAREIAAGRVRSVREWSALHAEHPGGRP